MPYKTEQFDYILFVATFCFLTDQLQALYEAKRILKIDGKLIIGMIDPHSQFGQNYDIGKQTIIETIDLINRSGFQIQNVYQTIFTAIENINKPEEVRSGYGSIAAAVYLGRGDATVHANRL